MLGRILVIEITCDFLWLRMFVNAMAMALERQNDIFDPFIYENNGNYEKREVKGHRLHVEEEDEGK